MTHSSLSPVRPAWGRYPTRGGEPGRPVSSSRLCSAIVPVTARIGHLSLLGPASSRTPSISCRNLRVRRFLTVCAGCNLCRAHATYVNVGCRQEDGVPKSGSDVRAAWALSLPMRWLAVLATWKLDVPPPVRRLSTTRSSNAPRLDELFWLATAEHLRGPPVRLPYRVAPASSGRTRPPAW